MDEPEGTFNIFSLAGGTDCVIEIHGELDHFPSLVGLRGLLQDAIADHPNMLIIDLAAVTSIDVSGLAVLAAARRRGLSTGTRLLLKAPNTNQGSSGRIGAGSGAADRPRSTSAAIDPAEVALS